MIGLKGSRVPMAFYTTGLIAAPFERQRWIDVIRKINANLKVEDEIVVCSLHWPGYFKKIKVRGKWRHICFCHYLEF